MNSESDFFISCLQFNLTGVFLLEKILLSTVAELDLQLEL